APLLKLTSPVYRKKENLRRFVNAIFPKDKISSWMEFNAISTNQEVEELLNSSRSTSQLEQLTRHQERIRKVWQKRAPKSTDIKDVFLYNDVRTMLADDLLMYTDKITMNFGLECRVPILDNDLVQFIESLDSSYKFNTKQGKIIHKAFATEYLPSSIVNRKKLGFKSPTEKWFKDKTTDIEEVFKKNEPFKDFFDLDNVNRMLQRHRDGENLEKQIFLLLSINCLLSEQQKPNLTTAI
ncbi:asparagine synthase C-terminal domain-containing protein, partial [Maribacter sp.]|nr:asparagine synthase C-terminal domain-containing protein [Maribacter sp.]